MDTFICNKCFKPSQRGKKPFSLTQCGHIFCQTCTPTAEKKCPQCKQIGVMSIPLQEPLLPKVAELFVPFSEPLATLQKIDTFQSSQIKITLQRFREVESKYEALKTHYYKVIRDSKLLSEKYYKLRAENEKLEKKLMFFEMHNNTTHSSSNTSTPVNPRGHDKMRYTPNSNFSQAQSYKTSTITPASTFGMSKERLTSDGFRIPNRIPLRSISSQTASDTSSTYTFRR